MKSLFKGIFVLAITGLSFSFTNAMTEETKLFEEHKENIRRGNLCLSCHDLEEIKELTHSSAWITVHKSVAIQKGSACLKCHSQDFCADCHSLRQGLKVSEKNFSDLQVSDPHRGEWKTIHVAEAKVDPSRCYRCHTKNFCIECHSRRKFSHPQRWLVIHGDEARKNIAGCSSCHEKGAHTVCISCHKVGQGGSPHPKGWSEEHIGIERKKDRPCVYCHSK